MSRLLVMTVRLTHLFTLKSNSLHPLALHLEQYVVPVYWSHNMEQIITTVISAISPAALPIVVCVLGCCFIYLKIGKERKQTKVERDNINEEFDLRLTLCEHDIAFMKEQNAVFSSKLDKILEELTAIKVELAKKAEK